MAKVKALRNFIYNGAVYKTGEVFDICGYSFSWLTDKGLVKTLSNKPQPAEKYDDDLVVTSGGLPALDDEEPPKSKQKVKRNG